MDMKIRLLLLAFGIILLCVLYALEAPWWLHLPAVALMIGTLFSFQVLDLKGDPKRYEKLNKKAVPSLIGNDFDDGAV